MDLKAAGRWSLYFGSYLDLSPINAEKMQKIDLETTVLLLE